MTATVEIPAKAPATVEPISIPVPGTQIETAPTLTPAQRKRRGEGVQTGSTAGRIGGYTALLIKVAVICVPLYFIVITSLKMRPDIYSDPITWWPNPFAPENYSYVMTTLDFGIYLRNSVIITAMLTVVEVTLGVLSAYAFAFLRFPGRNLLFLLVIATLMVPNQITIISNYALIAELG